jgi:hypothetical protein
MIKIVSALTIVASIGAIAGLAKASPSPLPDPDPVAGATPIVSWNTASAVLAGSGCTKNVDAWAVANGQDLSLVFTRLGINLPGNGTDGSLAARSTCTARIPVQIVRGWYFGEITQTLILGAEKSDNVDIDGAARTTFFQQPVTSAHVHVSKGAGTGFNNTELVGYGDDYFMEAQQCNGTNTRSGLFASNLSVSAARDTPQDNAIVGIDSMDIRYDIALEIFHCP